MRTALDTNVLAYAEGVNGEVRQKVARQVIFGLSAEDVLVPVQVLGELYNVLRRKAGRSAEQARLATASWRDAFATIPTTVEIMDAAMQLAAQHHLGIWDSVITAAAAGAGCRTLLSEDLQDGFDWRGIVVVNPFATVPRRPG